MPRKTLCTELAAEAMYAQLIHMTSTLTAHMGTAGCVPLGCLPDAGQRLTTGLCTQTAPSFLKGIERMHITHKPFEGDLSSCVSNGSAIKSLQETRIIQYGNQRNTLQEISTLQEIGSEVEEEAQRTIINQHRSVLGQPSFPAPI